MSDIESKSRLFADDCLCYPEIKYMEGTKNFRKCNMLQLTKKHNKIKASYTLGSIVHKHVKASNISV